MSDDLDKLSKRRRHIRKALLWTPAPEQSEGSAVAIRQTLLDLEDPFADANTTKAENAAALHQRICALFAGGVTRHKEIQRALEKEGIKVSIKTIGRALKQR